jgi:hypothetical protein
MNRHLFFGANGRAAIAEFPDPLNEVVALTRLARYTRPFLVFGESYKVMEAA